MEGSNFPSVSVMEALRVRVSNRGHLGEEIGLDVAHWSKK